MKTLHIRSLAALLGAAGLVAACGDNAWDGATGPGFGVDSEAPRVEIQSPDSGQTYAVGDPLRVEVRVRDDRGVEELEIAGFSLRGNAELGTQDRIERFEPRLIDFSDLQRDVRDSTVVRDLVAATDSVPEDTVYIVATARDSIGRVRADTTLVSLGGSRVRIVAPVTDKVVSAGAPLDASVVAMDARNPIRVVRLLLRRAPDEAPLATLTDSLGTPGDSVVSAFAYTVPGDYRGALYIEAEAVNAANITSASPAVAVRVEAPGQDAEAPVVEFSVEAPERAEAWDSVTVRVSATDNGERLSRVGATVVARRARDGLILARRGAELPAGEASGELRFALDELGVATPIDSTLTVHLEVNGFAYDTAQVSNCAAAITPERGQSLGCVDAASLPAGATVVLAEGTGALTRVLAVRGRTAPTEEEGSLLADLVADSVGLRVFATNIAKNRVDVLPFDSGDFGGTVAVGSEPWGVAIGVSRDTLFVANSGGTNISVVPLNTLAESRRIRTPDVRLWGVVYDVETDSVTSVTEYDYSDRPQFIGQVAGGQLMYSTKPTETRANGTIRIADFEKDQTVEFGRATEILTNYAEPSAGNGIVVNAINAGITTNNMLTVCPRRLREGQVDPPCVTSTAHGVAASLKALRDADLSDTRFDLGVWVESIGLTDTTFVSVSRDHSTISFGEGATAPDPGRVFLYKSAGGDLFGSTTETTDLVGNAAERVIGVALNGDGSFGVARGEQVYFYEDDLRLQGVVPSGSPSGGSALHPMNSNYPADDLKRRAFTSGVEEGGRPFIDVVDTYNFRLVRRIYIRDAVVGTLIAMPVGAGDPLAGEASLRLFGITEEGVMQLDVTDADLR